MVAKASLPPDLAEDEYPDLNEKRVLVSLKKVLAKKKTTRSKKKPKRSTSMRDRRLRIHESASENCHCQETDKHYRQQQQRSHRNLNRPCDSQRRHGNVRGNGQHLKRTRRREFSIVETNATATCWTTCCNPSWIRTIAKATIAAVKPSFSKTMELLTYAKFFHLRYHGARNKRAG